MSNKKWNVRKEYVANRDMHNPYVITYSYLHESMQSHYKLT